MKNVQIALAQPIGDQSIEPVTIQIAATVPQFRTLEDAADFYRIQAKTLASALTALPGGTFDRLLIELLTRKASYFRVPWDKP